MAKRTCSVKGCGKPHAARGWCKRHYYLWYNHGGAAETSLQQIFAEGDTTRLCTKCEKRQPIEMFAFRKNKSGVHKPISRCRACESADARERNAKKRDVINQNARARRDRRTPEEALRDDIRNAARKIGLDPGDMEAHYATHSGLCDICGKPPVDRRLAIDHNHKTGAFRGLTCRKCNAAIGFFEDDVQLVRAALRYFERDITGLVRTRAESGAKPVRRAHPTPRRPAVYADSPCQGCGEVMRRRGANQKWCTACAQSRRRAMRPQKRSTVDLLLF